MGDVSRAWRTIGSLALAVLLVTVHAPHAGADYDAGKRAWDAGKPAEALAQWRAAADAGDRRAMLELGRVYGMGLGAPQDYVLAHMWFNLAASRGEMAALKERDALAAKMTSAERAEAQKRAREWRPGGGPKAASAGQPATAPPQPSAGPPPERVIREAQGLLATLGYQPGPADGQWGGRTAKAYAAFLRDAGLPPSDVLTPDGIRALRAVAKRQRGEAEKQSAQPAQPRRPVAPAPRPGALRRAANAGDIDSLNAALKAGADVNARDGRGWTALMHAANKGYVLLVAPLLKAGADPDLRAPDGATALFMAAVHGHSEVIDLLMKAGAEVSIKGPKGKTPVDAARARYGDAEAARKKNESPAVIALLEGRTWAQVAEEVRRQEDDSAFAKAHSIGTAAAYAAYLSARPRGRHADKARRYAEQVRRVAELNKAMVQRLGRSFRDCSECPEMVAIPGGSYKMGSPGDEAERSTDEGPQHRVTIPRPIAVGKYEVTFAEWDACIAAGGCGGYRPEDEGWGRGRRPVINVSWNDAKSYVKWLSQETGKGYRLLTESEWEYVARAGRAGPFQFGGRFPRIKPTTQTETTRMVWAGRVCIGRRRFLWVHFRRMVLDCTMYMGMCGSGWRIAGTVTMTGHRRTGAPGRLAEIVEAACCAAVPGATFRGVLRSANRVGTPPGTGTAASVSVLPERSRRESLPLYIVCGVQGAEPPGRVS